MNTMGLSSLLKIAELAIDRETAEELLQEKKANMGEAYADWKQEHGFEGHGVVQDSADCRKMLFDTQIDYALVKDAKRNLSNTKRRLSTAIRSHRYGKGA